MKSRLTAVWLCLLCSAAEGQTSLEQRLEWFQRLKFGLFLHWGAYSQKGCIESWPLVWADRRWSNPGIKTKEEMSEFRKEYWALYRTPMRFDPREWSELAKRAGTAAGRLDFRPQLPYENA